MIRVEPIVAADLRLDEGGWDFAEAERAAIAAHWRAVIAEKPFLWNGKVLICTGAAVNDGVLSARLALTDFASFVACRDWGWPDPGASSCFAVPAVVSADGALLVGIMGPRTLNEGKAYPPSGSLEPRDVAADGRVDLRASMVAELREETGLDLGQAAAGPMVAIFEGPRLAVAQRHDLPLDFAEMEAVFQLHNAAEEDPELSAIEAIRNRSQIDSRMPFYAQEIIRQFLP
ncbi:MAG: NUDIX hydrolase [Alphaproteobacteria bacterium]|nr:NUDIX hydrolase [Alphaproteobacteria bacterium]